MNHVAGRIGRGLHGHHAGELLADRRVGKALKQARPYVGRKQFIEEFFRLRRILVLGARSSLYLSSTTRFLRDRQQLDRRRTLLTGGNEPHVGNMHRCQFTLGESRHQVIGNRLHRVKSRRVGDMRDSFGHFAFQKAEVANAFLADHVYIGRPTRFSGFIKVSNRHAQHIRIVAAAQATHAGEHYHCRFIDAFRLLHQRVFDVAHGPRQVRDKFSQLFSVRLCGGGTGERRLKARRGDELHRPRDLADVAHRFASFYQ